MGDVSYALMRILIARHIKREVDTCIQKFKAEAEAMDKEAPDFTTNILSLSVRMQVECKSTALRVLNQYDKEIQADSKLQEYKKELIKNGAT